MKGQVPEKTTKGRNHMKKRSLKALTLFLAVVLLLPCLDLGAAADDGKPDQDEFVLTESVYDVLEQYPDAFSEDILEKVVLRESDIPYSMEYTDIKDTNAVIRLRILEKDLSSVIYLNPDKTLREYFFGENVKYESEGKAFDKTNLLTYSEAESGYVNKDNDINVYLPDSLGEDRYVTLSGDDTVITFAPAVLMPENVTAEKRTKDRGTDYIVYTDAFGEYTKLVYTPTFSGVKEEIILERPRSEYVFSFEIKTNGSYLSAAENGSVSIVDGDETTAYIGEPVVFDSENRVMGCFVELTETEPGSSYLYTLSLDENDAAGAVFPITVDPTINYTTTTQIKDVQINNDSTVLYPNSDTIKIGYNGLSSIARNFIQFPSLNNKVSNFTSEDQICGVTFTFYNNMQTAGYSYYSFHPVITSWNPDSTTPQTGLFGAYTVLCTNNCVALTLGTTIADLTDIVKYCFNNSTYNGTVMKYTDENTAHYSTVGSINSSLAPKKPYITMTYAETLPTGEAYNITDKLIYRIKHYTQNKYITKNYSNNGYSTALETTNTTVGSTEVKSQFISVNYVGDGKYTLSFLIPPTSSDGDSTTIGYSTNLYLKVSTGGSSTVSTSTSLTNNAKWYIIYHTFELKYKIINAAYPYRYLNADSNGNITMSSDSSTAARWNFEKCGYDVPVYVQDALDACGAACGLMVLRYYDVFDVTENNFINIEENHFGHLNGDLYDRTYHDYIASTINYCSPFGTTYYYSSDNLNGYCSDITVYGQRLIALLSKVPIILQCKIYTDSSEMTYGFGYYSSGHYILLKGIYFDNSINEYICVINDSCRLKKNSVIENHSAERLTTLKALKKLNTDKAKIYIGELIQED